MGWVGGTYIPDNTSSQKEDTYSIEPLNLPQNASSDSTYFSSLFANMFQQQNSQTNQKILGTLGMTGQNTGCFKYRQVGK